MAYLILWLEVKEETHLGNLTQWVHQILVVSPAASADLALCTSPSYVTSATGEMKGKNFLAMNASSDPRTQRDSFVIAVKPELNLKKLMAQVVCEYPIFK